MGQSNSTLSKLQDLVDSVKDGDDFDEAKLEEIFNAFDQDKNTFLEGAEIIAFLNNLYEAVGGKAIGLESKDAVEQWTKAFDFDHNTKLDMSEVASVLYQTGLLARASRDAEDNAPLDIHSDNKAGVLPVYVNQLTGKNSLGAIIVLQEWWGVNQQIKNRALEFAAAGFITLIPDLYRGKIATDHEEAGHLMNDLDWLGAITDIRACVEYLRTTLKCDSVGIVGYCMGGALSLGSCSLVPGLDCGVVYYGSNFQLADPAGLKIPVMCHFGLNDSLAAFSDTKQQDALEAKLKSAEIDYEFFRYKNCGHAFTHEGGPNFVPSASEESFDRSVQFFKLRFQ